MNVKIPKFDGEELDVIHDPTEHKVCFKTEGSESETIVSDTFIRNLHDAR